MDKAILELQTNMNTADIDSMVEMLNRIIEEIPSLKSEDYSRYTMDFIIKELLKKFCCVELVEKIPDFFPLIKDPRNFYDEIEALFKDPLLIVPVLMLIHELSKNFIFEYDKFFEKLVLITNLENVQSEGFLLFLLVSFEHKIVSLSVIEDFLRILSFHSVYVSSKDCLKIIYCILVIMRMHPAAFKLSTKLKELYILAYSFDSICNIVKRIFLESKDPSRRPKHVFLESFSFPPFETGDK